VNVPHRLARVAGVVLLAFSGLTCSLRDDPAGPGAPLVGGLQVVPVLPPNFSRFAVGLGVERIHLVLGGQRQQALVDTVIPFGPNATSLTIRLPVLLSSTAESLSVQLSYETLSGTVLFTGQQTIQVRAGLPTTPPQVPIVYVGPGANVAYLYVTPSDSVVSFGDTALMDVQAYDSSNQLVSGVYVNWQTDDPTIVIDGQGRLKAPSSIGSAVVYAQTPNGSLGAALMYFAPGQIGITPDSIEVLPGQYHYFSVYSTLPFGSYTWSINGIPGGDSTVGTIDIYGTYYAPSTIPSPSIVNVCASAGLDSSCAQVQLATPPTPGGDLVVLGDTYLLTDAALSSQAGNRAFADKLVTYGGTGPRVTGRRVLFDRGRNAPCLASGICADSALNSLTGVLTNAGFSVQRVDTPSVYRNIAAGVKAIIMWNPTINLSDRETNELKRFAREGGRIILVVDDTTSVGSGSNMLYTANDILYRLGIRHYLNSIDAGCGAPTDISGPGIQPHQSTTGVAAVRINCGVEIGDYGGGYPLLIVTQQAVIGLGKVDPRPFVNYGD
jgi:hypothetical protein